MKKDLFRKPIFLVTNVSCVSKLTLWYLNMFSIDLVTRFKIGMYLLNWKKHLNAFPRSTDIIQVLNELVTDKRHIKVPQDRLLCPSHADNKKKNRFSTISF